MSVRMIATSVTMCGFGVVLIAALQRNLATTAHKVKQREDVVLVPPPAELKLVSLGYEAALVDYLWGKLLIEYGTHVLEKSPFDVARYLDGILALEPDYKPLFRYVDTLVAYRPPVGTEDDARLARKYLKEGTESRPYDHQIWMSYGQFVAFLGPSFLSAQEEKDQWRQEGARAIARAVEFGGDADRSLSVAGVLSRYGDRDATIRHLRRAYALTEDESLRERILASLGALQATAEREGAEQEAKQIDAQRRKVAPFLKSSEFRSMGPFIDAAACAGLSSALRVECATTWADARARRDFRKSD